MSSCPNCGSDLPLDSSECPNCSTQAFSASHISGMPQIAGYDMIALLGAGGMGSIYLAEEKSLGRRVAIKVVAGKLASEAHAHARFMREARTLATVEHANVVRIYAFGEVEGQPYLAMEYVDGETLADRIRRLGRLPVEEALRLMREILLALDAAWEKEIVHRDIKPSNVLIDRRGHVHVADFGLAKPKQLADNMLLTQSGHVLGTPYYVAPEQAQGKETNFRSDIYSCGILLYEMLAGERPFEGTTPFTVVAKHLNEPLPSIRQKRADVPNRVARLLEKMTAKAPEQRPESYAELIAAFDALLGITPSRPIVATETFSTLPISPKTQYSRPLIISAIVIAAAIGWQTYRVRKNFPKSAFPPAERRLVVAVTPFYGPDDDSAKEGRVMAALVERSITSRLGAGNVKVVGIDETKQPVRSHDAARQLGEKMDAAVVVWGEAFALKGETEIQPYFTLVRRTQPSEPGRPADNVRSVDVKAADPVVELTERSTGTVRMQSEAPNQIELRKTSAEGVGQMVSFLAAIHALYNENNTKKALQFFSQAPRTAETLRHWAMAYQRADDNASAIKTLEAALALEPRHVQSRAQLADLYLLSGRFKEAAAEYLRAAASGEAQTTSQAIAHRGLLYVREMFRHADLTDNQYVDTGALLAISPETEIVARRWRLPGTIRTFESQPDGFRIRYAADKNDKQIETLVFRGGDFERLPPPGGNYLLRMRAMKVAWVLPENFLGDVTGLMNSQAAHPRFRLKKDATATAPRTLPELERALRDVARRDPTQPWHLFFLGQTLWAQEREGEAQTVWQTLLSKDYPGILYSEFAWMSRYCERFGQQQWADRFFERASRDRHRMAQPIGFSVLIERLINVPLTRLHPEQLKDPERSYLLLRRTLALTGPTEGDHYAAAAWAGYFRRHGDLARARGEEIAARQFARFAFNYVSLHTLADYALYGFFSAWITFLGSALLLLHRANRGPSTVVAELRNRVARLKQIIPRQWTPFALGFAIAAMIILVGGVIAGTSWAPPAIVALSVIALVFLLHTTSVPSKPTIAYLSIRDRLTIALAFLLFVCASITLDVALSRIDTLSTLPIGIADSLGHPVLVSDLEDRLRKNPTPDLQDVTAAANYLGGNLERAKALHSGPITMPTNEQLFRAYTAGPSLVFRHLTDWSGPRKVRVIIGVTFIFGAVLLLAFLFVHPVEPPPLPAPRTPIAVLLARIGFLVVPGTFDLRRRSPVRGFFTLLLFTFSVLLAVVLRKAFPVMQSPGTMTAMSLPNLPTSSPFPPEFSKVDLMFAPPFARIFWAVALIAVISMIALHASRIRQIVRLFRDETLPQPTEEAPIAPLLQH